MTDWGAVADRVAGSVAGLDLELPGSHGVNGTADEHPSEVQSP